jgi:hypothetical protein
MPPAIAAPFAPAREIAAIAILTFWFVAFMDALPELREFLRP